MRDAKGKTQIRTGMLLFVLAALTVAFVGCSIDAPLAPNNNQLEGLNAIALVEGEFGPDPFSAVPDSGVNPGDGLGKSTVYWLASDTDCAVVGPDGGGINLCLDSDTSRLVIPRDALDEEVEIRAKAALFDTPEGSVRMYDFTPDGLVFLKPATLYLSTNLEKGTLLKLYWYNPTSRNWQLEQGSKTDENGVVIFTIDHFSKYAIS